MVVVPTLRHLHGDHSQCSLHAPCRAADLEADYAAFRTRIDTAEAQGPDALQRAIAAELHQMGSSRYWDLTYDPFTFKSRLY